MLMKKRQKITVRLLQEWHPSKNVGLDPIGLTRFSFKKVWWKCRKCGGEWEARISARSVGRGCPFCANLKASPVNCLAKHCPDISADWDKLRNATLTPKDVTPGSAKKVWWICSNGHRQYVSVRYRTQSGCLECRKQGKLNKLRAEGDHLAAKKGGRVLQLIKEGRIYKLELECDKEHKWWTRLDRLRHNTWCKVCVHKALAFTIKDAKKLAATYGGECLSTEYNNSTTPLIWRCKLGHTWESTYSNVAAGGWCRHCASGKSERICRALFKATFGNDFNKQRPKWLIGPSGSPLELDGYAQTLGIAFEFQGHQHTKKHDYFDKTVTSFEKRKMYDQVKSALCRQKGVKLFQIFPFEDISDLRRQLLREAKRLNIKLPKNPSTVSVSGAETASPDMTLRMLKAAKNARLKLHTDYCSDANQPILVECEDGHKWNTNIHRIEKGQHCRVCAGLVRLDLRDIKDWARKRGWTCLSKSYLDSRSNLTWKCSKGHIWEASWSNVSKKNRPTGCPECAGKRRHTISEMHSFAASRGWRCLSTNYVNKDAHLIWQCAKGHKWSVSYGNVKTYKDCPHCTGYAKSIHLKGE